MQGRAVLKSGLWLSIVFVTTSCESPVTVPPAGHLNASIAASGGPEAKSVLLVTRGRLSGQRARELAARHNMRLVYRFHFQDAIHVTYTNEADVDAVRRNPDVVSISRGARGVLLEDLRHWGFLGRSRGHGFGSVAPGGWGVRIGVFDTGIDCSHSDLSSGGYGGAGCGNSFTFVPNDTESPYTDPYGAYGHGTAVASVAVAQDNGSGVEGGASDGWFNSYRVVDWRDSSSNCIWVADAIDQATYDLIDVMNLSIGFRDTPENRAACAEMESAANFAYVAGLLLVASAGNVQSVGFDVALPAAYPSVMAVSGVECGANDNQSCAYDARFWTGSSRGFDVDISAAAAYVAVARKGAGIRYAYGTSFAAPMVSAAAMILIERYPDARRQAQAVRAWLKQHAYPPASEYFNPWAYGSGILDVNAAVQAGSPCNSGLCYIHPDP